MSFAQFLETAKTIKLPKEKEVSTILTNRSINQIALIERIHEQEKITKLICYIYSINDVGSKKLTKLINDIENVTLIYSVFKADAKKERESYFNNVISKIKRDGFCYKKAWSHAKIMMAETEKGNYYILNGSGNMANNARIENYCLLNDKEIFEQLEDFTNKL